MPEKGKVRAKVSELKISFVQIVIITDYPYIVNYLVCPIVRQQKVQK